MRISDHISQTNEKVYVAVNPKNACKFEFSNHSWVPFIDQIHSDVIFFAIISFQIHINLVTEWKHRICPNDIITFNQKLEMFQQNLYN